MAKRYVKQEYKSYHHDNLASVREIQTHVLNAMRPDADPLFNEVAHEAAMNGIHFCYGGEQGVCFMQPTTAKHGYYSLLKLIAKNKKMFRADIVDKWKCKPYTTLSRLVHGKLLDAVLEKNPKTKMPSSLYSLSKLGELYLDIASKYVVKRNM